MTKCHICEEHQYSSLAVQIRTFVNLQDIYIIFSSDRYRFFALKQEINVHTISQEASET